MSKTKLISIKLKQADLNLITKAHIMDHLATFIRQVRNRSSEHQRAMRLLTTELLAGQMISVLRQELDSMVRVIYLLAQPLDRRMLLIEDSVNGNKWSLSNSKAKVTDREMVALSQTLQGWTQSVYKFGCAFIHLSNLHDYNDRDALAQLPANEREDLLQHCRYYHGGPSQNSVRFDDLVPYLPRVLDKISSNLEYYLKDLESGIVRGANDY